MKTLTLEISGPDGKKIMLFDPSSDPDDVNSPTVHVGGAGKEEHARTIERRVNDYPKLVSYLSKRLAQINDGTDEGAEIVALIRKANGC